MKIISLALQESADTNWIILWGIDIDTTFVIKAHVSSKCFPAISVGDCLELCKIQSNKRQEIFAYGINKIGNKKEELKHILDAKASFPDSVENPRSFCNIAKIKEFVEIETEYSVVEIYGFPKEKKYIKIQDLKWNNYFKNLLDSDELNNLSESLESYSKYIIIDFNDFQQKEIMKIGALVVI